jgi:hypothetical protein
MPQNKTKLCYATKLSKIKTFIFVCFLVDIQ